MKKKIEWVKYKNSFVLGPSSFEEEGSITTEKTPIKIVSVMPTSEGLMPLSDNDNREVDIWLADTNFNITKEDAEIIGRVPGVEYFKVSGRYQFRIKVGKLFNHKEVKLNIERIVTDGDIFDGDAISELINKQKKLDCLEDSVRENLAMVLMKARKKKPYLVALWPNGVIQETHKLDEIFDLDYACCECGGWTESMV